MNAWWPCDRGTQTGPLIGSGPAVRVATVMTDEGMAPGDDTPIVCPNLTARNYEGVS